VKPACPSVAKKNDENFDDDDESVGIKEILAGDDIDSVVLQDMESSVPRRSVDENYLISKFLSRDGRQHVILLYNLLSGVPLGTI